MACRGTCVGGGFEPCHEGAWPRLRARCTTRVCQANSPARRSRRGGETARRLLPPRLTVRAGDGRRRLLGLPRKISGALAAPPRLRRANTRKQTRGGEGRGERTCAAVGAGGNAARSGRGLHGAGGHLAAGRCFGGAWARDLPSLIAAHSFEVRCASAGRRSADPAIGGGGEPQVAGGEAEQRADPPHALDPKRGSRFPGDGMFECSRHGIRYPADRMRDPEASDKRIGSG